jgi:hypothetical protein
VVGEIHSVVQNSRHLDHILASGAAHDEMPTAPAPARYVEASTVGAQFIAGNAARHVGAGIQGAQGFEERRSVKDGLALAEGVGGVFQDAKEIQFGLGPVLPQDRGEYASAFASLRFWAAGKLLIGEPGQVSNRRRGIREILELAPVQG